MASFLSNHILDIAAIAILAVGIISGRLRGFAKMAIAILGFAIAIAAAGFVSKTASEYVYTNFIRPSVIAAIENKAEEIKTEYNPSKQIINKLSEQGISISNEQLKTLLGVISKEKHKNVDTSLLTNSQFHATLNSVFTEYCGKITESLSGVLPDEIKENARKYLEENKELDNDKAKILDNNPLPFAELAERKIIAPIMIKVVSKVIFAATFAIVIALTTILSGIFGLLKKTDMVLKNTDCFLGGLVGLLYSVFILAVFSVLCSVFISLTSGSNPLINNNSIANSLFFKYIYSGTFILLSAVIR